MAHVDDARVFGQVVFVAMLVHGVNYVLGVREIVTGEILWPTFHSQGAELDDTVLSDALPLRRAGTVRRERPLEPFSSRSLVPVRVSIHLAPRPPWTPRTYLLTVKIR